MSDKPKDDGGHAFPSGHDDYRNDGMTLRDYFAGQALAGRMVNGTPTSYMANECYQAADLMLEARGK